MRYFIRCHRGKKGKYGSSLTNLKLCKKSEMSMGINARLGIKLIASPGNKIFYSLSAGNRFLSD
jgi:hypothetical protein